MKLFAVTVLSKCMEDTDKIRIISLLKSYKNYKNLMILINCVIHLITKSD